MPYPSGIMTLKAPTGRPSPWIGVRVARCD
jgi:hypothetical protein